MSVVPKEPPVSTLLRSDRDAASRWSAPLRVGLRVFDVVWAGRPRRFTLGSDLERGRLALLVLSH